MKFNTLKSAKEYLKKLTPLKLDKHFMLKDKNPSSFIINFINSYNLDYNTVYAKTGRIQCESHRSRTASDIFRITFFYFPKVRLYTVYKLLFERIKNRTIGSDICSVIHKRVYWSSAYGNFDQAPTDELSIDFTKLKCFEGLVDYYDSDDSYLKRFKIPHID